MKYDQDFSWVKNLQMTDVRKTPGTTAKSTTTSPPAPFQGRLFKESLLLTKNFTYLVSSFQVSKIRVSRRSEMLSSWFPVKQLTNAEPTLEPWLTRDHHTYPHFA